MRIKSDGQGFIESLINETIDKKCNKKKLDELINFFYKTLNFHEYFMYFVITFIKT